MEPSYDLRVVDDPAVEAAASVAAALAAAADERGVARLAVSGGSTAPPLFRALSSAIADLGRVEVWQVDERVAPDGDTARNLGQLLPYRWTIHAMPVTEPDLEMAANAYAAGLPGRFDVVHLGVGSDGHTASWPPGRDLGRLEGSDVVVIPDFHGHDRLTITPSVVARGGQRHVLVTGPEKAPVVRAWLGGDRDLPASLIPAAGTTVWLDPAAASLLETPG